MTLALKDEIMCQIRFDDNIRLETWIFLDWARAHLMLHEVEEGSKRRRSSFAVRPHCNQIMRFVVYVSTWKMWRTPAMLTSRSFGNSERNCRAPVHPLSRAELHLSYEPREKRPFILCLKAEAFLSRPQVIVIKHYKILYFAIFSDTSYNTFSKHIRQFYS
jgi:hypothetical protein